jgi:hypothetical protein
MRAPTEAGFYWFKRDGADQWIVVHAAEWQRGWLITYHGSDQDFELSEAFKRTKSSGLVKGEFVGPLNPPA